jgi:hypothetical protein
MAKFASPNIDGWQLNGMEIDVKNVNDKESPHRLSWVQRAGGAVSCTEGKTGSSC